LISLFTEFFRVVVPVIDSVELINGPGWVPDHKKSLIVHVLEFLYTVQKYQALVFNNAVQTMYFLVFC